MATSKQIRRILTLLDRGIQISRVSEALTLQTGGEKTPKGSPWGAQLERMAAAVSRFDEEELDAISDDTAGRSLDRASDG